MYNIADYLKKFSLIIGSEGGKKQILIEEIKNQLGVLLPKEAIKVKDAVASIQASPMVKNSIFIKKKYILEAIEKRGARLSDLR